MTPPRCGIRRTAPRVAQPRKMLHIWCIVRCLCMFDIRCNARGAAPPCMTLFKWCLCTFIYFIYTNMVYLIMVFTVLHPVRHGLPCLYIWNKSYCARAYITCTQCWRPSIIWFFLWYMLKIFHNIGACKIFVLRARERARTHGRAPAPARADGVASTYPPGRPY